MSPTRIKICGITSAADARAVVASGADALGLVFYEPSSRYVSLDQAREIVAAVPPFVTVVALFVDADEAQIRQVLASVAIDVLQFQGDESADFCAQFERPWIKAVRVREETDLVREAQNFIGARALLLDSWQDGVPGGTGKTFDWSLADVELALPIILAGGLNADNVAAAVSQLQPAGVDISGGVESAPGRKDGDKVRKFVSAVRAADAAAGARD